MKSKMKIDFVSDVSCPWCVIGLKSLETALDRLGDQVAADIHFQPFELNPQMPAEGQDLGEHLAQKYGSTPEQSQRNREAIRGRGAELGFTFSMANRSRIYNTFDAHRLLHWAETQAGPDSEVKEDALAGADTEATGLQYALKEALFKAYFTDGENPASHDLLVRIADEVGLNPQRAQEILASDEFASDVREREKFYLGQGIHSVPAIIINDRHLISGGQPAEVFEQALRKIAAES